ncbi:MAG: ABC transporter ATP-binding protein/permease [Anaerolineae bacterium]|jgi:ATP-binding cassette subfamily B protein|nr:ABC transporter ATP-binding protein/permease [Anaerolineae bacterium]
MMIDGARRIFDRETLKPKNTLATLRRFGSYFAQHPLALALVSIFIIGAAWTSVIAPDLVGQAVDCYIAPSPLRPDACWYTTVDPAWFGANAGEAAVVATRLAGVTQVVVLLVLVYLFNAVCSGLAFYAMRYAGSLSIRAIQRDLFRQIHRLSLNFFSKNEAGDIMSRVTNDIDTVNQAFSFALMQVLLGTLTVTWIIIRMLQTSVPYALLSLAIVPVMILMTYWFSNQARKAFRQARSNLGSVNAGLQESIAGAREVQAFNREEESIAKFEASNNANRAANVRASLFTSALNPVLEALGYVSLGIVVVVGGLGLLGRIAFIDPATLTIGMVFAFVGYTQRANQPIQQIALLWTNLQSAIAGGERIFGLIDEPLEVVDAPDAKPMPPITGAVRFEQVTAEYVKGEPVLRGVSFEAQVGQMVAIVGPTGAGKTTIINLLPRFYDVTGGAVKIDGIDVRTVTQDTLRSQIGIVLQDTFLFSTSVLENIRYGRPDATDEEVQAAAQMVAAHEFIERLPNGYDTLLGERGSGLSQGQRQLIAIARVALMNPRILILDEATSSVDTRTERIIQAAFEKLLRGRTSFVIAHRLSTIRNADQVFMLKAGEIVERGTHQALLAHKGAYYELYMSQFRATDDAPPPAPAAPRLTPQPAGD